MIAEDQPNEIYLTSLNRAQCEKIHEAALQILENTGVVFQSRRALEILKKGGAKVDNTTVYLSEAMVQRALESAPGSFILYDQEGQAAADVGGRRCLYGTGSDCLNILDHRTGQRRDPLVGDLIELVRLCDALPQIDFLMSMVIPTDFPRSVAERIQMEMMLRYSTKPIIGVSFQFEGTKDIIRMAELAAGGEKALRDKPFMIHFIQPVRALVHNEDTVEKLLYTAEKGLPMVYLVSAIMGITSPITAAGYQAMGAAGQLAALVLSQLVREGTPFIVRGGRIVVADMKTMVSTFADPGNRIFSSDMAHFYDLPSFGTAGVSDSKHPDWQAVSEVGLTLMADSLVGANLIHDVGYMESGLTFSAELLVLCSEIISWIRAFKQGVAINKDTLALELIDELGFAGDFLSTDHTLQHYREQWEPELFDRLDYTGWQRQGGRTVQDRVRERIEGILASPPRSRLSKRVAGKISEISTAAGNGASD